MGELERGKRAAEGALSAAQEELEEACRDLEDFGRRLARSRGDHAAAMEQLEEARRALSAAREELAETKRALGATREALAATAEELLSTKKALGEAGEELASADRALSAAAGAAGAAGGGAAAVRPVPASDCKEDGEATVVAVTTGPVPVAPAGNAAPQAAEEVEGGRKGPGQDEEAARAAREAAERRLRATEQRLAASNGRLADSERKHALTSERLALAEARLAMLTQQRKSGKQEQEPEKEEEERETDDEVSRPASGAQQTGTTSEPKPEPAHEEEEVDALRLRAEEAERGAAESRRSLAEASRQLASLVAVARAQGGGAAEAAVASYDSGDSVEHYHRHHGNDLSQGFSEEGGRGGARVLRSQLERANQLRVAAEKKAASLLRRLAQVKAEADLVVLEAERAEVSKVIFFYGCWVEFEAAFFGTVRWNGCVAGLLFPRLGDPVVVCVALLLLLTVPLTVRCLGRGPTRRLFLVADALLYRQGESRLTAVLGAREKRTFKNVFFE